MRTRFHAQSILLLSALVLQRALGTSAHAVEKRAQYLDSYDTPLNFDKRDEHNIGHDIPHLKPFETNVPPSPIHEHAHGHSTPLLEINETLILKWHKPTPPSYGTYDFDDINSTSKHPGLMGIHALMMSLAFFVALPVGTWRKSPKSAPILMGDTYTQVLRLDQRRILCTPFPSPLSMV